LHKLLSEAIDSDDKRPTHIHVEADLPSSASARLFSQLAIDKAAPLR